MTELVPREDIENHVGHERHATEHYGRMNTVEGRFYILHSLECLDSGIDLRECKFSVALDHGTSGFEHWHENVPVKLSVKDGMVTPT